MYKFMTDDDLEEMETEENALEAAKDSTLYKSLPDIATADIAKKKVKAAAIERNHRKLQRLITMVFCLTIAGGFVLYPELERRSVILSSFLILAFIGMLGFCFYFFRLVEKRREKFLMHVLDLIGKEAPVIEESAKEIKEELKGEEN